MRIWHYKLIPYLPSGQLLSQWKELNSIFKNQNKHILINYVYNYPRDYLFRYTQLVLNEMRNRAFDIKTFDNYNHYFRDINPDISSLKKWLVYKEHDDEYLTICYYNLKEKYLRGQKDFHKRVWDKIENFYKKEKGAFEKDN